MSSPIPRTSGSDPADVRHSSAVNPTSALALSGLLKVQRRWSLASLAGLEPSHSDLTNAAYGGLAALDGTGPDPTGSAGPDPTGSIERRWPVSGAASPVLPTTGRSRLPVHLEDSRWWNVPSDPVDSTLVGSGVRDESSDLRKDQQRPRWRSPWC
jgi:hypothetical protein